MKKVLAIYVFLFVGLCPIFPLAAQNSIALDDSFSSINIIEIGQYYTDENLVSHLQYIQSLENNQFSPLHETDGSFLPSGEIWVKLPLKNTSSQNKDFMIEVREVRVNELRFFSKSGTQWDSTAITGDYHPFNSREIYHPSFVYSFSIEAQQSIEVYICYRKIGETITLNTELWEAQHFAIKDRNEHFTFSIFLGFLICITIITVFIAAVSRQPLLLSFALYCISCLLMVLVITGYGFMYIWPNQPYWNGLGYLFVSFYYMSMIQMTKLYLETSHYAPLAHRFFNIAQLLILFVFVPFVLVHWHLPSIAKTIIGKSGLVVLLLSTLMIIGTSLLIIFKKRTWGSVVFLIGFGFTITAAIFFELEQLGAQDTIWDIEMTLLFILLDFILLLVVFSNQIRQTFVKNNQLQKDLAQSKLTAANALLEGQLNERRRLSQELHDGISIKIALLKMELSSLFSQKTKEQTQLLESVGDIAKDIRAFTHAISPLNLERQTLAEAIEDLIFQIENQTELNVQFELDQFEETHLKSIQKHAIFQSIQELFNNTIKYAEASHIGISLSQNGQFLMTYEDNGKGFDTEKIHSGMGLKNIQSRAHLLNGTFIIYSGPEGSRFEFSL